jgi:hypothetical protein
MSLERFPFDYDALGKGDVITVERLQDLTGLTYGTTAFSLQVLRYQKVIEDELLARGRAVTVCSEKGSLRILTDAEASEYGAKLFASRFRQMMTAHRGCLRVDVTNLDDEQKAAHGRTLLTQGAMLAAARTAKRESLTAHERVTPVPFVGVK